MGWFSSSSPTTSQPAAAIANPEASTDGGYIAPDRTARAQCWEGRDNFFKCLDRHNIVDSVKEDEKARKGCMPELMEFEKYCASSWVTYFKKRRVMEHQRDLTLRKLSEEGATPMEGSGVGGGGAASLKGR
ncbi:Cytochrome c oxidase subunit 6B-like protein new16 [Teratosphaeria destructans]|uniref:Cytochrome c oxidase subunit 6B-like protein new16 n=1 Tax=Teratosphaeria destructans TaxID=418781 RepID=A0A9W7SNI0_9PEZI|nr:Cytochrome c oxidase subunit 6B-like protein new16 [Teratosphaeria destructans]